MRACRRWRLFAAGIAAIGFLYVPGTSAQTGPGTPGDPACPERTISFVTELYGSVAAAAQENGRSVEDVQAIIDAYCTTP